MHIIGSRIVCPSACSLVVTLALAIAAFTCPKALADVTVDAGVKRDGAFTEPSPWVHDNLDLHEAEDAYLQLFFHTAGFREQQGLNFSSLLSFLSVAWWHGLEKGNQALQKAYATNKDLQKPYAAHGLADSLEYVQLRSPSIFGGLYGLFHDEQVHTTHYAAALFNAGLFGYTLYILGQYARQKIRARSQKKNPVLFRANQVKLSRYFSPRFLKVTLWVETLLLFALVYQDAKYQNAAHFGNNYGYRIRTKSGAKDCLFTFAKNGADALPLSPIYFKISHCKSADSGFEKKGLESSVTNGVLEFSKSIDDQMELGVKMFTESTHAHKASYKFDAEKQIFVHSKKINTK